MLIDAIEAAARTVDEPSREKFEAVVQRVTNIKLRQGQLDVCGLTMEDIRILQSTLTDVKWEHPPHRLALNFSQHQFGAGE